MPTETDLVAALSGREELAPDPAPVLAGVRRATTRHRRRRVVTAAATGLLVTGVAAVVGLVAAPALDGPAPPGVPAEDLPQLFQPIDGIWYPYTFTIQAGTAAGYEVRPVEVGADHQIAEIRPVGSDEVHARVVVSREDGTGPVMVIPIQPEAEETSAPPEPSTVRWEYAPGLSAKITSSAGHPLDEATLRAIAAEIQFAEPSPITVPYRLDYLPEGMLPLRVERDITTAGSFESHLSLLAEDPPGDSGHIQLISFDDPSVSPDLAGLDWQAETFGGQPAECAVSSIVDQDFHYCRVAYDELTVVISFREAQAEAERIIQELHPATWDDPDTWYPLPEALPLD